MKFLNERGNALIEFVFLGLFAQLVIAGFLLQLGTDFRSQLAAESIARQVLRSAQLGQSEQQLDELLVQIRMLFGLQIQDVRVTRNVSCSSVGTQEVVAQVRNKSFDAIGYCID